MINPSPAECDLWPESLHRSTYPTWRLPHSEQSICGGCLSSSWQPCTEDSTTSPWVLLSAPRSRSGTTRLDTERGEDQWHHRSVIHNYKLWINVNVKTWEVTYICVVTADHLSIRNLEKTNHQFKHGTMFTWRIHTHLYVQVHTLVCTYMVVNLWTESVCTWLQMQYRGSLGS